ncbi:putrescine-ornithine antiporter [Pantoea coffeiphila]|uniref:Putrescine transporter PotE n=1 Tax=Pantoea coffeiphila TaxID=1465635 RepID=A0A2S9I9D0_9GAMM|nr:putrescine-ornithine antiporter [Pantoea coffeiphila]PRD14412.1 putrescine-ornithine antiporter [Pantoea coffeiphila]
MSDSKPTKKMGVIQLIILTIINMMGSGIILLPTKLAEVGTISILSWLVTALGSLALAYSFAKCGRFSRKPGGMFGYAQYPLGTGGNFISNYTYVISCLVTNVTIGITAVGYGVELFNVLLTPVGVCLATVAVLWVTTLTNFGGSAVTGKLGSITIWGVIIPVVGLCIIGWFWFSPEQYVQAWNPHNKPLFSAVSASISITLWAFLGLESACANSDAVENPERNVPIAVLGGTLGAAVIYIVSTNVIAGIVPNLDLVNSTAPFGVAFSYMFTPLVGKIIMALMCLACIGSLLGWQFTFAQVCKSGAEAGFYHRVFTHVNKMGAPVKGMLILVIGQTIVTFMTISPSLTKQFDILVNLAVITNLIPYLLSMAALITMQRLADVSKSEMRVTNTIMVIATLYTYYALYSAGFEALTWGALATFLGWNLYGFIAPKFELERNRIEDKQYMENHDK